MIKQNPILLLFLTLILTPVFSQNTINAYDKDGKRHGKWQKFFPKTKQLRYQGQFYHGKEIDTFKYYTMKNRKSVLSAIKVFHPYNKISDVIFYSSNAHKISEGQINERNYIGTWTYYHKNSDQVMTLENYNKQGVLHGYRKVFFKNGQLAEQSIYKNGKLDGQSLFFSDTGIKLQESWYKNDMLNGKTVFYDNSGNIKSEGNYVNNIKDGIWKYYNGNTLIRKVNHTTKDVLFKQ